MITGAAEPKHVDQAIDSKGNIIPGTTSTIQITSTSLPNSDQKNLAQLVPFACPKQYVYSPSHNPPGNGRYESATAVVLAGLLISEVVTEVNNTIGGYIDKVKAKFTTESAPVTITLKDGLWTQDHAAFNCIIIGQKAKTGQNTPPNPWDFVMAIGLEKNDTVRPVAYRLVPLYYHLSRSSAITTVPADKNTGAITVSVGITLTTVTGSKGATKAIDATVVLPALDLPVCSGSSPDSCKDENNGQTDQKMAALMEAAATPWFTLPDPHKEDPECTDNCIPATLTVALTALGNGAPNFATAHTELDNGTAALTKFLTQYAPTK